MLAQQPSDCSRRVGASGRRREQAPRLSQPQREQVPPLSQPRREQAPRLSQPQREHAPPLSQPGREQAPPWRERVERRHPPSPAQSSAARNAMKKLRTIKHPYLVKCLDAGEINDQKGGGTIYIVTEPVQPLSEVLSELQQTPASIVWGVYTLAAAVNFLNIDCKIVHGQVSIEAIFVDRGMDWKLGGFELCSAAMGAKTQLGF